MSGLKVQERAWVNATAVKKSRAINEIYCLCRRQIDIVGPETIIDNKFSSNNTTDKSFHLLCMETVGIWDWQLAHTVAPRRI